MVKTDETFLVCLGPNVSVCLFQSIQDKGSGLHYCHACVEERDTCGQYHFSPWCTSSLVVLSVAATAFLHKPFGQREKERRGNGNS